MADNKRWFKVWTSILSDPDFDDLENHTIGIWVRLGALIAKHGEKGVIVVSKNQIIKRLGISVEDLFKVESELLKINVQIKDNCNGTIFVIMKNWSKYQVDSTSYERVKRFRQNQNDNGDETPQKKSKKKKRREVDKEVEKEKEYPPDIVELSTLLATRINENHPNNSSLSSEKWEKTVLSWCDPIEKLNRIDKQDLLQIEKVIKWCQKDSFWSANILSGDALRKQFDQLSAKMVKSPKGTTQGKDRYPGINKWLDGKKAQAEEEDKNEEQ